VPASNFPDYEAFPAAGANVNAYAFEVGEYIDLEAEEPPHGWKEGTAAKFHLHITSKDKDAGNTKAQFKLWVAYADIDNTWTEVSLTAEEDIRLIDNDYQHYLLEMGDVDLSLLDIGSQIICRVGRIAASSNEYSKEVFITQVGAHMECDTVGSRAYNAK
jgi:hypothetical protein